MDERPPSVPSPRAAARRRRRVALLAVLVILAGCAAGSARAPAPRASAPPSFHAQADELCLLAAEHETALAPARITDLHDLARYAAAVVPVARGFAAALGRLHAPPADARLWRIYLRRLNAQIEAEARAGRAAAASDRRALRRAVAAVRSTDPSAAAARLGLDACARSRRTVGAGTTSPA